MELKIVFMGTPKFGAIVLEGLIKANLKPVLVITAPDKPVGRKQILTPPLVKVMAENYKIPVFQPKKINDGGLEVKNYKPDLIVVAAYGQIISQAILDIPRHGSLNLHPSLLPKYRGASPIQYAVLNGEKETGVTVILMDTQMDHGPIVSQKEIVIGKNETAEQLSGRLAALGTELLIDTIPNWLGGEIKPRCQDEKRATYTKILKKEDGKIDWKKSAESIECQIRAFNPWPGTYTIYNGKILKILKAEVSKSHLVFKEVQLEGKKPMSFKDFLQGHPDYAR